MSTALHIELTGMAALDRFIDRLAHLDTRSLLEGVAGLIEDQTVERIAETKRAPDGTAWGPLSDKYDAWKGRCFPGIGMMELHGNLRDSIETYITSATEAEVGVGSNVKYAAAQQFGYSPRNLPARPYMGLSADNEREIDQHVNDWIRGVLDGG